MFYIVTHQIKNFVVIFTARKLNLYSTLLFLESVSTARKLNYQKNVAHRHFRAYKLKCFYRFHSSLQLKLQTYIHCPNINVYIIFVSSFFQRNFNRPNLCDILADDSQIWSKFSILTSKRTNTLQQNSFKNSYVDRTCATSAVYTMIQLMDSHAAMVSIKHNK